MSRRQEFELAIAPAPWARPRAVGTRFGVRIFKSHRARADSEAFQWLLRARGAEIVDGPVELFVEFVRLRPKASKARVPITRPDLDQYVKFVMDAGSGLLWNDDAQIVALHAAKSYGPSECVRMTVVPI